MNFLFYVQTVQPHHIPRNLDQYIGLFLYWGNTKRGQCIGLLGTYIYIVGLLALLYEKVRQLFELIKVYYCRISTCSDIQKVHPTSFTHILFAAN